MGVRPFLPSQRALILEHAHIFEARIPFQVRDPRPQAYSTRSISSSLNCDIVYVLRRFDDDLVSAHGPIWS